MSALDFDGDDVLAALQQIVDLGRAISFLPLPIIEICFAVGTAVT